MEHFPPVYYDIKSNGKISICTTSHAIKDKMNLQRRVENAGNNLQMVTTYLKYAFRNHVTVNILHPLAYHLCNKHSISIDRLALRNKQALLCWFTENWDIIKASIPNINSINVGPIPPNLTPKVERKQSVIIDASDITTLLNYH